MKRLALCLMLLAGLLAGCQESGGGSASTTEDFTTATDSTRGPAAAAQRAKDQLGQMAGQLAQVSQALADVSRLAGAPPAADPGPAPSLPGLAMAIVPVTTQERRAMEENGLLPWLLARAQRPVDSFELTSRSEFFAVLYDKTGRWEGKEVVFVWYHGSPKKPYCQPMATRFARIADSPWPLAVTSAWSAPSSLGRGMNVLGLRCVVDFESWSTSRAYGPRIVQARPLEGWREEPDGSRTPIPGPAVLAEADLNILEPGVMVWR